MVLYQVGGTAVAQDVERTFFPAAEWSVRRPPEVGMSANALDELAEVLGGRGCVVRHGRVVKAWGSQSEKSDWLSSAKPVLSTLLFFAVHEGKVSGVDSLVGDWGWDLSAKDRTMTFRHLANMMSGYARPEPPGAAWAYNDYGIQLYQKTLFERVFAEDAAVVANDPKRLGFLQLEDGLEFMPHTNRLVASVRDFARIALFWLNRGNWNGTQLLPRSLFDRYMRPCVPEDLPHTAKAPTNDYLGIGTFGGGSDHFTNCGAGIYGFNWWFNGTGRLHPEALTWPDAPPDTFMSIGAGGNCSVMIPSLDLVLVSARGNWGDLIAGDPDCLFNRHIRLLAGSVNDRLVPRSSIKESPLVNESDAMTVPRWRPQDFVFDSAAGPDNPFMVPFSATVTGPDSRSFKVPGFYDGDGVWKVRVRPEVEGDWSLATESTDPELDGRTAHFVCVPNENRNVHGMLRVDPEHPYHFMYEDGTRYFLLGYECDWLWALDATEPGLPRLEPFLDKLAQYGFNHILLNTYAHDAPWQAGKTGDDDYGPPPLYAWEGTNEQPDHARFNLAFWQHYDRVMKALLDRGIVAHMMVRVYNKMVRWPANRSAEDDLYFRWLIARYAAFPNLVWDFSKEAFNEKDGEYKLDRIRLLRREDPYGHLITSHDDNAYGRPGYEECMDFRSDQQHSDWHATLLAQRKQREWPIVNAEFGYEHGPKGIDDKTYGGVSSPEEVCRRAWEVCMAGGYPVYYYTYTAWDVIRPEDAPTGYAYMRNLRAFFERTHYWLLEPADERVNRGYCLRNPGSGECVVFLDKAEPFELRLDERSARMTAEWYDPLTGAVTQGPQIAEGVNRLVPPNTDKAGMTVLHVFSR